MVLAQCESRLDVGRFQELLAAGMRGAEQVCVCWRVGGGLVGLDTLDRWAQICARLSIVIPINYHDLPKICTKVSALLEAEVREHTKQLAGAKLALGQLPK